MAKNYKTSVNKLYKKYNIAFEQNNGDYRIVPGYTDTKTGNIKPIKFPSDIEKALTYFESDYKMSNPENTPENRLKRYQELEFMIYNEGLMWTSCNIYSNETTHVDEQNNIIGITAKKEVKKHFHEWIDNIGLTDNILKACGWDLSLYADSFLIPSIDLATKRGIINVIPISPYEVTDRIEFNAIKVKEAMKHNKKYMNKLMSRHENLKQLVNVLKNDIKDSNYSEYYKSYLFGYIVGEEALPPWSVFHMRRYSTASEFYPFGRPLFIGSLARYKSYKTSEMIVDMARVASFPKEIYKLMNARDLSHSELAMRINEIREQVQNITTETRNPDELGIGEPIFTVDGLYEYTLESPNINLDQIADLENKRTDLIFSTGIPEGYLDTNKGWGSSGQSLLQQSKIVARKVFENQTAMLEVIAEMYKVHLLITEDLQGEDTEFELFMHFPVIEETSDRQRVKSDSIRLANDISTNLGQALGLDRNEALPANVVKDIYGKYSFLEPEEVDKWVASYEISKEIQEKIKKFNENSNEKLKRLSEDIIIKTYLTSKKNLRMYEGVCNRKHTYLSHNKLNGSCIDLIKEEIKSNKLEENN